YCTATNSGEIVWEMKLDGDLEKEGGRLAAAPVAAGQYLFVSTLSGHVLQIDPKSGKTKKKHEIGAPMRFPPAVHNGRIYATTQDGRVVCINTGDRKLTGWPMSGRDARHSRVYRSGK
ncbi:MAG: PQQ-binding-like beta-propeller repeat protein, partial [Pirellulales bacterium]